MRTGGWGIKRNDITRVYSCVNFWNMKMLNQKIILRNAENKGCIWSFRVKNALTSWEKLQDRGEPGRN